MASGTHFLSPAPTVHITGKRCEGWCAGYAAIITKLKLPVPPPVVNIIISAKTRRTKTAGYLVLPLSYLPHDNNEISRIEALYNHLVFALRYEGVDLLVFAKLSERLNKKELLELVNIEPSGRYSRRIWFLLEWVSGKRINGKDDLRKKSYVHALDEKLQFGIVGIRSPRHLVINNLPGTDKFCALIRKTDHIAKHLSNNYLDLHQKQISGIRKDILQRASAMLLLKDSKASFTIEGESPKSQRAARWGTAIGQAGSSDLTKEELVRLQHLIIERTRFIHMGLRTKGGFVGEHNRTSGEPIPEHISAKPEDLNNLMDGLLETNRMLIKADIHPVLASAIIAFGFVFIHPFQDGNGRIHRFLIHHILAKKQFTSQSFQFPISSAILDHIQEYQQVLQAHSRPLLDFIEWTETRDHNVSVTNETKDYYRFFDATRQAEFLFDCLEDTVRNIVPKEMRYMTRYDSFKTRLEKRFQIPGNMIAMLVRFLDQHQGQLSKRAREKEFRSLSEKEIVEIESVYASIFLSEEDPVG